MGQSSSLDWSGSAALVKTVPNGLTDSYKAPAAKGGAKRPLCVLALRADAPDLQIGRQTTAQRTTSTGTVSTYPAPRSVCISSWLAPCSSSFLRRRPTWVSIARS